MFYVYCISLLIGGLSIVNVVFSYQSKHIDPQFWSTFKFQLLMLPLMLAANLSIGYGIRFGFKASGQLSFVLIAAKCLEIKIFDARKDSIIPEYWTQDPCRCLYKGTARKAALKLS